jgi:hypothetical protein
VLFCNRDESKKQGLPFAGHVTQAVSAAEASDAGQKSIEHLNEGGLLLDCSMEEAKLRKNFDQLRWLDTYDACRCQALFERFRRNGTWQDPTVVALRAFADMDEDRRRNVPFLKYVPKKMQALQDSTSRCSSKTVPKNNGHWPSGSMPNSSKSFAK